MASPNQDPIHFSNAIPIEDRVSVGADLSHLSAAEPEPYCDRQFGNRWSWTPPEDAAVYGRTSAVPRGPFDDEARDVLRVPFRRVPVIELGSLEDALAFGRGNVSIDPSVTGMWRGQPRHYSLRRDPVDGRRLYGVEGADEPSLLPSASRQGIYFPDLFEAWSGLLDLYIEERLEALCADWTSKAADLRYEAESFRSSYRYRGWGFATAQHYGLPSVGLDLTGDIRVALYFALHRFAIDPKTGVLSVTRATEDDDPIVYGLGVHEHDLYEDEKLAPSWLSCARPRAQNAHFFGNAWGDSPNRAADRIYVAARLKDHTRWRSPLTIEQVFPSILEDKFLAFLLKAKANFDVPAVGDLLRRIYFR